MYQETEFYLQQKSLITPICKKNNSCQPWGFSYKKYRKKSGTWSGHNSCRIIIRFKVRIWPYYHHHILEKIRVIALSKKYGETCCQAVLFLPLEFIYGYTVANPPPSHHINNHRVSRGLERLVLQWKFCHFFDAQEGGPHKNGICIMN